MAEFEGLALKRHDERIIIHFVSSHHSYLPIRYLTFPTHLPTCLFVLARHHLQSWLAKTTRREYVLIVSKDYDCFYAAVFEREDPKLRFLPLAVQQKQIIVTCNYEARRRGLHKLQLVKEARRMCPEVVIVLGEDLTRFRNASKDNYNFLASCSWSKKVERLGFDEVSICRCLNHDAFHTDPCRCLWMSLT